MPKQEIDQSGQGNVATVVRGDGNSVTVSYGNAKLSLVERHKRKGEIEKELDILDPNLRKIPFVGLADQGLRQWLDGDGIRIRCMIGRGGSGKTRLAVELCEFAEAQGWTSGFVSRDELERFQREGHLPKWRWEKTLIVVDYAAGSARILRAWFEVLSSLHEPQQPLRILLLERHADREVGWWADTIRLTGASYRIDKLIDLPEPTEIAGIRDAGQRRELLAHVMRLECERLKVPILRPPSPGSDPAFDARTADDRLENEPLYLAMAGIAAVEKGLANVLPMTRTDLADYLAQREKRRIEGVAQDRGIDPAFLTHLGACVTLVGDTGKDELVAMAREEREGLDFPHTQHPEALASALVEALSNQSTKKAQAIRPDLVGEAFLLDRISACSSSAQKGIIGRATARPGSLVAETIVRTAQDFVGDETRHPILDWFSWLVGDTSCVDTLLNIMDIIPKDTLCLAQPAVSLLNRLCERIFAEGGPRLGFLPGLYVNLASRLSATGRFQQAALACELAVELCRSVSGEDAKMLRPVLAMALSNLSMCRSNTGQLEAALDAASESTKIYGEMVDIGTRFDRFEQAMALVNLSTLLFEGDFFTEALTVIEEAIAVCESAPPSSHYDSHVVLASCLINKATVLVCMNKKQEAGEASFHAVAEFRKAAAVKPDAYRPQLAHSLANTAVTLLSLGDSQNALAFSSEAEQLYRILADRFSELFLPHLARSLSIQCLILKSNRDFGGAMLKVMEALGIFP